MSHDDNSADHSKPAPKENDQNTRGLVGDHSSPARAIVLTILAIILVVIVVAVLLQVFVAQQIPQLTEARLMAAQELWDQQGPANYDMDVEIRGAQPGTVHLEIRDGKVIEMTRDGRSPPRRTWDVWTVEGQFETLERELVLAEDPQHEMDVAEGTKLQLRCEFDPEYGFPRRYHRYATGGAPEVFWRVTRFEPR